MEVLIIGLIVVALMVYASTKIKKSAAEAFEREEIEEENFRLTKPAGYLHPYKENSAFAFEAHTKDFGDDDAKDLRRSRATLQIVSNADFEAITQQAKKSADRIISKRFVEDTPAAQKIFYLETEKVEKKVKIITFWKIVESRARQRIYQFQVSVLEEFIDDFRESANEMIGSFEVR